MKILLINPVIIDKLFNIRIKSEPLGLEYVAAMLLPEHEVEILDGGPAPLTYDEIINTVKNFQPQVIGISVPYSITIKTAKNLAKAIKNIFPDVLIVLGGIAATFTAEYLIKDPYIDIIVIGEGELTFRELVGKYEVGSMKWEVGSGKYEVGSWKYEVGSGKYEVGSGKYRSQILHPKSQISSIPGLCYKTPDNEIKFTPQRAIIKKLDTLPFPAHSILKNKIYYERTILAGRGCPYGCIYCSSSVFWSQYRKRSVESMISEVKTLLEPDLLYSNKRITFMDDNFTVDKARVEKFCAELLNLKEQITWSCNGRMENINEDLLMTMQKAGCTGIFLGIESGSPKILNFLKRKYTPDDVIKFTTLCKKLGINTVTSFIVGLPYETQEDLEQTFSLIEKIPDTSGVFILTPFPGTPIFDNPEKFDLTILPHLPEEDNINQCVWITNKYLTREEILSAYYKGAGICIRKTKKFSNPAS